MKALILTQLIIIIYAQRSFSNIENEPLKTKRNVVMQPLPSISFLRGGSINMMNFKPEMPIAWTNRHKQPFNPAWMDYCDPYHCNDYHKRVCGLSQGNMKFKWFQSMCHLLLNNQCSNFRGFLKYDSVDTKYCHLYVMFLRAGCPNFKDCEDKVDPVCAVSSVDGHIVLFKNQCFMDAFNCRNSTLQEYEAVYMSSCENTLPDLNEGKIILK